MKKLILLSIFLMIGSMAILAQDPPEPPSDAGSGGGPVGGGSPVGSGLVIMVALAAGYGTRKIYQAKRKL